MSRPSSINPLTARTQADRDLVALIFSGMVRLGPGDAVRGDLAERWKVENDGGRYTFTIRSDARWHDGVPVTADDVVFTIELMQDPAYNGPRAGSWSDVTVTKVSDRVVRFDLRTPLGGFLLAMRQPLLPVHLLRDVPVAELADAPFSTAPVGSGWYRLVAWDPVGARLEPVVRPSPAALALPSGEPGPSPAVVPPASPSPSSSAGPVARRPPLELRFFGSPVSMTESYRTGDLDIVTGLPASAAAALAKTAGSRLIRYPRATVTAIALNLRPAYPAVRDDAVRRALLRVIDRPTIIEEIASGVAVRADGLIPPTSWAFSKPDSRAIIHDRNAAAAELQEAGWTKKDGRWYADGADEPFAIELISPDAESNSIVLATAQEAARQWTSFGIPTTVLPLSPSVFVGDRLRRARFEAAAVDINVGLDPDLYPLLGSRQAGIGGSNISGFQDLELDEKLTAARRPGDDAARTKAYAALQAYLSTAQVMLPLYWRDEPIVLSERVTGPAKHLLGDPSDRFWDVLDWRLASD
jgi:peptide/nickel transport system substrate-binding protein